MKGRPILYVFCLVENHKVLIPNSRNKAPFDPESVASTDNWYQGIDYFMMPSQRNLGFNINVSF